MPKPTYDLYLSHSSDDKGLVRSIAEGLREDGFTIWFDEREVLPGDLILSKIEEGLDASKKVIFFVSILRQIE